MNESHRLLNFFANNYYLNFYRKISFSRSCAEALLKAMSSHFFSTSGSASDRILSFNRSETGFPVCIR